MSDKLIKINVTVGNIQKGTHYSNKECPINLAARKFFKDDIQIAAKVLYYRIIQFDDVSMKTGAESYLKPIVLPDEVVNFNRRFDKGESVAPFSFELMVPEEALKATDSVMEIVKKIKKETPKPKRTPRKKKKP
jgi:hypothetical protein